MFKQRKSKVSSNQNVHKGARRDKGDRRSFAPPRVFPLIDQFSRLILQDRRSMPDRRIANIQVEVHYRGIRDDVLKKFKES